MGMILLLGLKEILWNPSILMMKYPLFVLAFLIMMVPSTPYREMILSISKNFIEKKMVLE